MSKYFSARQIAKSINTLGIVHPFLGITFLVCKREKLPVGEMEEFAMNTHTEAFLKKHHRIDPHSDYFFQPFKSSDKRKKWVRPDYAEKGLQAVNTQTFRDAFLHTPGSSIWGWSPDYVEVLKTRLPMRRKIPAFNLAVWIYKERAWPKSSTFSNVLNTFLNEFNLTKREIDGLLDITLPTPMAKEGSFSKDIATWDDLRESIPAPPGAKPEEGGTLSYLEMRGVGPAEKFVLEPGDRLTLITGDNGLGKTFLLECCWWALTGTWAGRQALPNRLSRGSKLKTEITFSIKGTRAKADRKTIPYDWKSSTWPAPKSRPTIPGLIVYARVDGSFAVWDPAKQSHVDVGSHAVYSGSDVWDGLQGKIEGLVRDWVRWQNASDRSVFETFKLVLGRLSPPDLGRLEPGPPVRVPGDPREIPTIKHPYGITPITYSSAGVRRIITLTYLIVWAWTEHVIAAGLSRTRPQKRVVVLVDEMEAHLHPKWQRAVLPALLSIPEMLSSELEAQYIVATHSPLVLASSEELFDQETDALMHLDLQGEKVTLKEMDFVKFGDVSAWLTSPVFELRHARSSSAEAAIETAKALQTSKDVNKAEVRDVSEKLIRHLPPDDKFWPRWIVFAEKYGVVL